MRLADLSTYLDYGDFGGGGGGGGDGEGREAILGGGTVVT
jgi:hypothetical protein